ncbi:mobile element protein [Rhodococcus aetherivorans]|uniref:Mobile element protein n=1 Tax=Rhodococcus aetherivorans TaxID=191292 RepID=A0ABQ0YJV8_9NOCA|nr:mobile element protein [Rhodococcus aetherivorans]
MATAPITVRGVLTCPSTSLAAFAAQTVTGGRQQRHRDRPAETRRLAERGSATAQEHRRRRRKDARRPPSFPSPDVDARHRCQHCSSHPARGRRRFGVHFRGPSGRLRGIAPVTHRSGSSIRGEHPARSGNRKLERALFLSAFAALHDPTSRAYYDRKHAEGKKHNVALICLARRRCDILYAMLKNKTFYRVRDSVSRRTSGCAADPPRCGAYLPDLLDRVWNGRIEPGKVFDLTLPLAQVAEAYAAMDKRRATKVLLRP